MANFVTTFMVVSAAFIAWLLFLRTSVLVIRRTWKEPRVRHKPDLAQFNRSTAPVPLAKSGRRVVLGREGNDTTPPPDYDEFRRVRIGGLRGLKKHLKRK